MTYFNLKVKYDLFLNSKIKKKLLPDSSINIWQIDKFSEYQNFSIFIKKFILNILFYKFIEKSRFFSSGNMVFTFWDTGNSKTQQKNPSVPRFSVAEFYLFFCRINFYFPHPHTKYVRKVVSFIEKVCLSVETITKNYLTDFHEILRVNIWRYILDQVLIWANLESRVASYRLKTTQKRCISDI